MILIPDETGGYVVEVSSPPVCYSQGDTKTEAMANIQEVIELHAVGETVPEEVGEALLKVV